jgi:HEAT repeat protein
MNRKRIVALAAVLAFTAVGLFAAQDKGKEKELYDSGKKAVAQKNWAAAVEALRALETSFPKSEKLNESMYWLGYSLDRMAASLEDAARALEMRKEALERLDGLVERFPEGPWTRDGKVLRIEIAEALTKSGLREYRKYINGGIEGGVYDQDMPGKPKNPELEIKLVALNALLQIDPEKAFPVLEKIVREEKQEELRDKALLVISQSRDARVVPLLTEMAMSDPAPEIRSRAAFWLGQRHDAESFAALVKIYAYANVDRKIKDQILMAFSQSDDTKARAKLLEIAKTDKDPAIRKKAVFWLGQSGGENVIPALTEIYKSASEPEIKNQILMSLAQTKGDKGLAVLIDLARTETDLELKKQMIFWIGQSGNPEALKFLREIIEK